MRRAYLSAAALLFLALSGCRAKVEPSKLPLLVVGIDGADRKVIQSLWQRNKLPHLRALAERGTFGSLDTDYAKSPVIWTTVVTGVEPKEHGIKDFVASTPAGDVPVSSTIRKRPALWNMLGRVGRRVAVAGWWASWPAEEVNGFVLSDRAALGLERAIWPPERKADLERWIAEAKAGGPKFGTRTQVEMQDRLVVLAAKAALEEQHDLVLAYLRSPDIASHRSLHEFSYSPKDDTAEDPVSLAYQATDQAIGEMLAVAPPRTRVLVVSDHGFYRKSPPEIEVFLDLNRVFAELGLLELDADKMVDVARSVAWTSDTQGFFERKKIVFAAGLTPADEARLTERVRVALGRCRFKSGEPVLEIVEPNAKELEHHAKLVVRVRTQVADGEVWIDGRKIERAITDWGTLSGGHGSSTRGVLFAAGEGFAKGADTDGASIKTLAATILYALGLPTGEDFMAEPTFSLFDAAFRQSNPFRQIATWGVREAGAPEASKADQQLMDDLGALGYLN